MMLFNPTPLEKLTTLVNDLLDKQAVLKEELEVLRIESASMRGNEESKDAEIQRLHGALASKDEEIKMLNDDLAAKDAEIEAIVAKIESLLG
jgi:predicted RNase H-like nuclease (RuvC/YqgF family)